MSDENIYDVPASQSNCPCENENAYQISAWNESDPSVETMADMDPEVNITQVCPGGFMYTIAAGDTLYGLASRYSTTVDAILRANPGLNPNQLYIGQRICIPVHRPQPGPGIGGCQGGFPYVIVAGDTLYGIAARYGTTVEAILRANPTINPNQLFVGQRICIPVHRPQPGPGPGPEGCRGGFIYTVAVGDTLYAIAVHNGTSVGAIMQVNPGLDPNRLFIGQRICIPVPRPQPGPGPMPGPGPGPGVPCPNGFIYTIVAGDTLYAIAARYGISVDAILRANPGLDPNSLVVARRICIPRPIL